MLDFSGKLFDSIFLEIEEQAGKKKEGSRSVSGIASVEEISRSSHRISIEGLDVSQFQHNPIVLAAHEQVVPGTLMPGAIGTIERVAKVDGKKALKFYNMTFDTDPLSEAWFEKIQKRIVRMVSIGFVPTRYSYEKTEVGRGDKKREVFFVDVPESELVEISVVPIGANRSAFINSVDAQSQERVAAMEKEVKELRAELESWKTQGKQSLKDLLGSAIEAFAPKKGPGA